MGFIFSGNYLSFLIKPSLCMSIMRLFIFSVACNVYVDHHVGIESNYIDCRFSPLSILSPN